MKESQNLGKATKIRKSATLLICTTCCLLIGGQHTLDILRRASLSRQDTQGFGLDNKNILFDGIGEFDYLRGEPTANTKRTTDNNVRWDIHAQKADVKILSGTLNFKYTIDQVKIDSTLSYLHCNTRESFTKKLKAQAIVQDGNPSLSSAEGVHRGREQTVYEILLLHDTAHLANDWSESGILHELCIDGLRAVLQQESYIKSGQQQKQERPFVSVTAIDLDPSASGLHLYYALRNLEESGIVSGKPMVVISPVESGKTVISLGTYASEWLPPDIEERNEGVAITNNMQLMNPDQGGDLKANSRKLEEVPNLHERRNLQTRLDSYHTGALLLTHVVKVWIAISTVDVLESSAEALRAFLLANIDVLSIHGNADVGGKRASERLEGAAGAHSVGIDGDYMQNQETIVRIISNFLF